MDPKFASKMHFLLTKVDIFQNFHKDLCLDYFWSESGMSKHIFWGILDVLRVKIDDFHHLKGKQMPLRKFSFEML